MNTSLKQYGSCNHLSQVFELDGRNHYCRPVLTQAHKRRAGRIMAQAVSLRSLIAETRF